MSISETDISKPSTGHRNRNLSIGSRSICIGLTVGWPESSLGYVILTHCDDICYDLSENGSATIQMIMNFGSCIGALIPTYIADVYGRRFAFAVAALLNFTFWLILVTLQGNLMRLQIICSAALGGFATGIYVTTTALYVSEISSPMTRGTIGALGAFFAYAGALFGSCFVFVTYNHIISAVMALLAIMFLVTIQLWMIESPYYLFMQGKTLEAKLSLKELRGARTVLEIEEEFRTIELFFTTKTGESPQDSRCNVGVLSSKSSRNGKYATVGIIFLCITQMVGAYGMDDYTEHFLNDIVPDHGRVIIASLNLCSVAVCLWVIEKFGRRQILLAISIVGSSISCLIMGIVTLTQNNITAGKESPSPLPAAILGLYYLVYTIGLTPILPVLTGEIFPSRGKTVVLGVCISFIYFCSIVIQALFETLNARQGSDLAFATFALIGSLGIPVAFFFVPETRGKTLHEIQNDLENCTILVS